MMKNNTSSDLLSDNPDDYSESKNDNGAVPLDNFSSTGSTLGQSSSDCKRDQTASETLFSKEFIEDDQKLLKRTVIFKVKKKQLKQ